ncbi:hypothetical protein [Bartonella tamiae]|uniref:Lipoprotein n=2 Tax=Bartonella tamiae TaxID=373638 RepID=J0ZQR8_9HYPH|nr:hypothetical protein [Bartonella tamiae]EJF91003.1 hypothetical protein ME5_00335 [Bartonella tamiae Th239]EJF93332.1 hypothetical protein MEG_01546 [Bartonella tamiae Th307]
MGGMKNLFFAKTMMLSSLLLIGGCAAQATAWTEKITLQHVEMPKECSGWQKIDIKTRSRYQLMKDDQRALVDIDAHNLRGRNLGCWE